jgi:hypothetical protein
MPREREVGFCHGLLDLRALRGGERRLGGVPFKIAQIAGQPAAVMVHNRAFMNRSLPDQVRIRFDNTASSIVFLHTLDHRASQHYWLRQELAGQYLMVYDDGLYATMDLKYGINITSFDGNEVRWGYCPKGKSMAGAGLVWEGQMRSGTTAALYAAEWVNPRPDSPIAYILFQATPKPTGMNPILVAATAVQAPNSPDPATTVVLRPASMLIANPPVGAKRHDLSRGQMVSDDRWVSESGVEVRLVGGAAIEKPNFALQTPTHVVGHAVIDGVTPAIPLTDGARQAGEILITLPAPEVLSGIRFIGTYRPEYTTGVDFPPNPCNFEVQVGAGDGTFQPVAAQHDYVADEQAPRWIPMPSEPIRQIRLRFVPNERGWIGGICSLEIFNASSP